MPSLSPSLRLSYLLPCLLLLLLAAALTACGQARRTAHAPKARMKLQTYQTEKFRLSAGPAAVDGYPATIDEARFINSSGGSFPVPYGHFLNSSWEGSGTAWAVGEELQAVPDSLEIRWFSYTEDKFYEGHFLMPQERLYTLIKQGRWSKFEKKQITYTSLVVCVAPTGVVYVWLVMDGSNKVFIGRYQAREIEYDYAHHRPGVDRVASVREGRQKASPEAQQQIATGTINTKRWDAYLKTYPWQLVFSQPLTLTDAGIDFLNAEATGNPPTPDLAAFMQTWLAPSLKPVPKSAMLYVAGQYGRTKLFKVDHFNEVETMAAFQALAAKYPGQPLTLFIDTNEQLSKATLSLRAGGQIIPLTKSPVELFDPN